MGGRIAVLIPCYNEAATIGRVVSEYKASLPGAEIFVYDNNSTDGSAEIARRAGAAVRTETRQGKGNVVRTMFREVDADCYLLIDADDAFPADIARDTTALVLDDGFDMVIGDRLSTTYSKEMKRAFHGTGNKVVRHLVNRLFKGDVQDILSGYRVMSKPFVKTFPVLSPGFEIETEMTIHALDNRFRIKSVPIQYRERLDGSASKVNTFRDGFKVIMKIFNMFKDYRPLLFFGLVALALFVVSAVLFVPEFLFFMEERYILSVPKLVVDIFLLLAALQSFTCGLILDTNARRNKQNFEVQLNLYTETIRNQ
jgi:glycosyltransferase involved in cell wall biosynthesis